MTSTEQRSSKDLVQRLRRLSGGAKVVAGLAADEIERLQRQVDTLSRELAKFVTAHQQKADRLASEPRTAQPVAYRVEFEDGAVELWDGSAIPYEPLFGAEVTPLYAHAPPPDDDRRDAERYRELRGHGVIFDAGKPGDGARRVFGIGLDEKVDILRSAVTKPARCANCDEVTGDKASCPVCRPHETSVGCRHCGSKPLATENGRCEECGKYQSVNGTYEDL